MQLRDTTIDSVSVDQQNTGPVCRVTATVTHPPAGDQIKVFVALPMESWNGRFQATGGGGYAGGSANNITRPADLGYVAAATDTGHAGGSGGFALDANGRLNWQLIRDNASLGVHQMTVVAKALTRELYGTPPRYSYFNGCSSGGRQGLMEAQRFPEDYDGILAIAPAINWAHFLPADMWPQVVMLGARNFLPACKADMATAAAVKACDTLDGVADEVLEDPRRCPFDPKALVGASTDGCGEFTSADAAVIQQVWEGPRRADGTWLWYTARARDSADPPGRNDRLAANRSTVPDRARMAPVFSSAGSVVGLHHADGGTLRTAVRPVGGAVRSSHRHGQSRSVPVQEGERQADHLAWMGG